MSASASKDWAGIKPNTHTGFGSNNETAIFPAMAAEFSSASSVATVATAIAVAVACAP